MLLSFLIPTIAGREAQFNALCDEIVRQANVLGVSRKVSIIYCRDDKELSIGAKRQSLIEQCKAKYCVMIDDDDMIPPYYLETVLPILKEESPDCLTYQEAIYSNGHHSQTVDHSNAYTSWGGIRGKFAHVRTPYYKDIIKTSIVKKIGFSDMRYGEDKDFADRLKTSGLIKNDYHIEKIMYIYNAPTALSAVEHNQRYGIK